MAILGIFGKKPPAPSRAVAELRAAAAQFGPAPAPGNRMGTRRRSAVRYLDGARHDRLTADWLTTPMTADDIVNRHLRILVARSREQAANNDYARSFARMCHQNIVGPRGVMLQAQSRDEFGKLDTHANQAIEAAFDRWAHRDHCDVAGKLSWRAIQASCVISAAVNGEFMLRKIYGEDAGAFGFALQLLDPMRCNPQFDEDNLPGGRFIRGGIEFNAYGRPLAYYFASDHDWKTYTWSFAGRDYLRIPADEIIHGFVPDMVGQKRGLPWMATGLFRLKQLMGFEDAALVNARVGASKMGFIRWREGMGPEFSEDEQLGMQMEASPGEFQVLPDGAELQDWNPQFPSGEFATFNKAMLRGIAAGFGVAYNNLANDLEHVNFSSIRQGALDEREHWKERQEWLIEALMQPVFEAWLPRALLGGHITVKGKSLKPERLARYAVVSWQPRRWAWIDPKSDIEAAVTAKNQMLMAPSQIIRDQGRDPSDVWREIAADIEQMKAAGIPENFIQAVFLDKNLQASVMASMHETNQANATNSTQNKESNDVRAKRQGNA